MAMLEYNEILKGKVILLNGEPYEVLDAHVFRKQQRKPVNATKLRNLISGRIVEHSFHVSDKAEEAEIETKKVKYLYLNKGEYWFCDETNPGNRYQLSQEVLGIAIKFVKVGSVVDALLFDDKIFGVKLPIKVELKVTEAADAVRGDTAKGGNKSVTLETGVAITTPMFVKEGDIVRVNTETGEYVERVS